MSPRLPYKIRKRGDLTYYSIPSYSPSWRQFRTTGIPEYEGGIGASEIANVLGYSEYRPSKTELFHHKVGTWPIQIFDNVNMWHGRYDEEKIKDLWECWDGTEDGYMRIHDELSQLSKYERNLQVPRRAFEVNSIIVNDKYPYLFASLDRRMKKGEMNYITMEPTVTSCPLEFKTMNSYTGRKWENAFPINYYFQLQQQMMVFNANYAEIAILEDGRTFRVIPFQRHEKVCESIAENGQKFWSDIQEGRRLYRNILRLEKRQKYDQMEQAEIALANLEPPPDNTRAYMEYMVERYTLSKDKAVGHDDQFQKLIRDKLITALTKRLKAEQQQIKNDLVLDAKRLDVDRFEFPNGRGKVSFYQKEGAKVFTMKNSIKYDIDEDLSERIKDAALGKFQQMNIKV